MALWLGSSRCAHVRRVPRSVPPFHGRLAARRRRSAPGPFTQLVRGGASGSTDYASRRMGGSGEAQREAARILREMLDVDAPLPGALLEVARRELGSERVAHCVRLVRDSTLTRRCYALASVAALVVGSRSLGDSWWSRPRRRSAGPGRRDEGSAPDAMLAFGHRKAAPQQWPTALEDENLSRAPESARVRSRFSDLRNGQRELTLPAPFRTLLPSRTGAATHVD